MGGTTRRYVKGPNGVPIPVPNQRDVVVVGSGPSLLGSGLGATIDTCVARVVYDLWFLGCWLQDHRELFR